MGFRATAKLRVANLFILCFSQTDEFLLEWVNDFPETTTHYDLAAEIKLENMGRIPKSAAGKKKGRKKGRARAVVDTASTAITDFVWPDWMKVSDELQGEPQRRLKPKQEAAAAAAATPGRATAGRTSRRAGTRSSARRAALRSGPVAAAPAPPTDPLALPSKHITWHDIMLTGLSDPLLTADTLDNIPQIGAAVEGLDSVSSGMPCTWVGFQDFVKYMRLVYPVPVSPDLPPLGPVLDKCFQQRMDPNNPNSDPLVLLGTLLALFFDPVWSVKLLSEF